MCRVLEVHPSGYYAWRRRPESDRALENRRLSGLIEQYWRESGRVYGHRRLHQDLRDAGERCGRHRLLRLMHRAGLRAEVGCRQPMNAGILREQEVSTEIGAIHRCRA